jgi:hypothetical protein
MGLTGWFDVVVRRGGDRRQVGINQSEKKKKMKGKNVGTGGRSQIGE